VIIASIILLIVDLLVAGVIVACARGGIRVNSLVGIRLPMVMSSEDAWRIGHAAALPATLLGAVVVAALALASVVTQLEEVRRVLVLTGSIALVVSLLVAALFANRAAAA
jgi:hypothetical protein